MALNKAISAPGCFPSAAVEELNDLLTFDDLLIKNPTATYLVVVSTDAMSDAGIFAGDLLILDSSMKPLAGDVVLAYVDGTPAVRFLHFQGRTPVLSTGTTSNILKPEVELRIFAVVSAVIRRYRK